MPEPAAKPDISDPGRAARGRPGANGKRFHPALAAAILLVTTASLANGQTPPTPTGNLVPQGSPLPRILPPTPPDVAPGPQLQPLPDPASVAPGSTVRVNSTAVVGATVYPSDLLSGLTGGLVGPSVPLSQVERARQALLSRYRTDGYVLTTVRADVDAAGHLRFIVTEGRIRDVRLEGNIGPAGTQVLRFLNRLVDGRPVKVEDLERYLLLAQDVPGVTLRSVLRPTDEPGALTLVAQVSRKAFGGLAIADNRAFRLTGPEQLLTVGTFNSFTQFGERTDVSILHSFNNTQTFGQATTEFFVGSSGLRVRLYGGAGTLNPSGDLRILGYDGRTRVFGTQASYPVIRRRQQTLNINAALDAIESDIKIDSGPANAAGQPTPARASYDSLRVARVGFDYELEDLIAGPARPGVNTAVLRLSKGLQAFGATRNGDPQAGRVGQRTDFFKATAEVTRTQTLFRPWEGASVSLFGLVAGQVSGSVLPSAEKFFLGGVRYDRGYYAGEVTGDNAITVSAELQLNFGVPVNAFGLSAEVSAQPYIFYDWARTWENQSVDVNRHLESAGGGVRLQITPYTHFDVEGVHRFVRRPTPGANVSALKGDAIYWRFLGRF